MVEGLRHFPEYFALAAQAGLRDTLRAIIAAAPLYTPTMPRTGKLLSVRMTNCGSLGWLTDMSGGYRYQATHPVTGKPWPPIPDALLTLWNDVSNCTALPQACLVNWYGPTAKMGLHTDGDEETFDAPVVSVSLGDDAWFRIGGSTRKAPTQRLKLSSGDVLVMAGIARRAYHGIDRIIPATSTLLDSPGRLNLTLRRVTAF